MFRFLLYVLFFAAVAGCQNGKRNPEYMRQASGKPGDIVIIMDSVQWNGPLGKEVKKLFYADVQGLPRQEYIFNVIHLHPSSRIQMLTELKNLVFIFTLDQKTPGSRNVIKRFDPEMIQRAKTDTSFYIVTEENVYAKGQEVVYLFGDTQENLIHHLQQKGDNLIDFFENTERERLTKKIFNTKSGSDISDFMRKEQQIEMHFTGGYKLADKTNEFIWFRKIEPEVDSDIFISWKPYESQYQLLPDSLIDWRNEIAKKYLFEDPESPDSYLVTETEIPFNPIVAKQVDFNGHFAMEIRGLWRTNNKSMGGPFVGYALVDQTRGLLYYIEGFTYSPGKPQREIMRELEAILWTFKTSDEISVKK